LCANIFNAEPADYVEATGVSRARIVISGRREAGDCAAGGCPLPSAYITQSLPREGLRLGLLLWPMLQSLEKKSLAVSVRGKVFKREDLSLDFLK
jgi:hypothetical protein